MTKKLTRSDGPFTIQHVPSKKFLPKSYKPGDSSRPKFIQPSMSFTANPVEVKLFTNPSSAEKCRKLIARAAERYNEFPEGSNGYHYYVSATRDLRVVAVTLSVVEPE